MKCLKKSPALATPDSRECGSALAIACGQARFRVFVHSGAKSLTSGFLPRPACCSGRTLHLPRNFAPGYALCAKPAYSGVVHDLFRTPEALSLRACVAE